MKNPNEIFDIRALFIEINHKMSDHTLNSSENRDYYGYIELVLHTVSGNYHDGYHQYAEAIEWLGLNKTDCYYDEEEMDFDYVDSRFSEWCGLLVNEFKKRHYFDRITEWAFHIGNLPDEGSLCLTFRYKLWEFKLTHEHFESPITTVYHFNKEDGEIEAETEKARLEEEYPETTWHIVEG